MKKYKYMHLIDDCPARYAEEEQICYVCFYGDFIGKLVPTLKQIRKEQRLSNRWREAKGFSEVKDYSYIRVEI